MAELAIVTLTPRGHQLAQRLLERGLAGEIINADSHVRAVLTESFQAGRPLVCVMSLGIVVRILGPITQDKRVEPAVVVVDEAGQFAVSVLGGHAAGANELAKKVATAIGAVPVITTASDALGLPAVDQIGQHWGWKIERTDWLTTVAAAVVRGEAIGVYQQAGRRDWWQVFGAWPPRFQIVESWPVHGNWAGLLVISDLALPGLDLYPTVVYRPPTLVLGVGCRRRVPCAEIEALFQHVCQAHGFSPLSLGLVATVSLKASEPGLVEFAARHAVPLRSFGVEELRLWRKEDLPTPSKKVHDTLGIWGVAEPAAMLAAGTNRLEMPKYKGRDTTMALARRENV